MECIKHILFYELLQGKLLNAVIFPIAYTFRNKVKKNSWLWGFLHDGCLYGDKNWNPTQKETFWIAYKWAMRNPLHNRYYANSCMVDEFNFTGIATSKNGMSAGYWRTYKTETGDRNGKFLDFEKSIFGKQNIQFCMNYEDGRIVKGFRRSVCMPYKIGKLIVVHSRRFGYERGLKQSSFNFKIFKGVENLEGFKKWKKLKFKKELI
jgi:hypothetical protein